jgi:hypothetical protein
MVSALVRVPTFKVLNINAPFVDDSYSPAIDAYLVVLP